MVARPLTCGRHTASRGKVMRSLRIELSASIAASVAVFVIAVIAGQVFVATTTPATATAAPASTISCLNRPLTQIGASAISGTTDLGLTIDDVALAVGLSSGTGGHLYTAWLRFHERPG